MLQLYIFNNFTFINNVCENLSFNTSRNKSVIKATPNAMLIINSYVVSYFILLINSYVVSYFILLYKNIHLQGVFYWENMKFYQDMFILCNFQQDDLKWVLCLVKHCCTISNNCLFSILQIFTGLPLFFVNILTLPITGNDASKRYGSQSSIVIVIQNYSPVRYFIMSIWMIFNGLP